MDRGFAEGEQKAKQFDQKISGSFNAAARGANGLGDAASKAGRFAKAANDNIAGSAARAALAYDGLIARVTMLGTVIGSIIGLLASSVFINLADTWSDLSARVGLAVGNMDAAAQVMTRLSSIARRTYSDLSTTAESFIANTTALKELGYSTNQQLDYTEALNNALVVSGAKGERAASVQLALSKAMALGKLSGDELNTVIQTGGRVAEVLAAQLGVGVNQLRGLGAQGKITGETIYQALTSRLIQLREEADSMPATVGDAFTLIRNSLLTLVGSFDKMTGISAALSGLLISVADGIDAITAGLTYLAANMDKVVEIATVLGIAMGVAFGPLILGMVIELIAAISGGLVSALATLTAVMMANPMIAFAAAIVTAVTAAYYFRDEIQKAIGVDVVGLIKDAANYVLNSFTAAFEDLKFIWSNLPDIVGAAAVGATNAAIGAIQTLLNSAAQLLNGFIDQVNAALAKADAVLPGNGYRLGNIAAPQIDQMSNPYADRLGAANDNHRANVEAIMSRDTIGDFAGGFKSATPDVISLDNAVKGLESSTGKADKAAQRAAKAYNRIVEGAKEFIADQQLQAETLGMSAEEANRLRYEQELLNEATRAGIKLTPQQTEELKGLAAQMAATEASTTALRDAFDFAKDVSQGFFSDIAQGLQQGKGIWESFKDAALNALNKIADKLIEMASDDLITSLFKGIGGGTGGGFLDFVLGGFKGFATGGYTGNGDSRKAAGVVHGKEYVFNEAATARIGVANLDAMHRGARGNVMPVVQNLAANNNEASPIGFTFAPVIQGSSGQGGSSDDMIKQLRTMFDREWMPRTLKALKEAKRQGKLK